MSNDTAMQRNYKKITEKMNKRCDLQQRQMWTLRLNAEVTLIWTFGT